MRKLFISLVALFVGVAGLYAQNPMEQLPLDPEVRVIEGIRSFENFTPDWVYNTSGWRAKPNGKPT